jgi:hypothetical protein
VLGRLLPDPQLDRRLAQRGRQIGDLRLKLCSATLEMPMLGRFPA